MLTPFSDTSVILWRYKRSFASWP